MKMEIKNFLDNLSKLDNIRQWEERDSIIKESVSQHSFKVSAIAYFLLKKLGAVAETHPFFTAFKAECLSYAILHDFDEAVIGRDISHVVKYNSYNGEMIRKAINDFVEYREKMDFENLLPHPTEVIIGFVKVCDWIALYTFCKRNADLGCLAFSEEWKYCKMNLKIAVDKFSVLFLKSSGIKCEEFFNNIILSL